MALNSPGVQVSIIDQSQYTPTQAGSIAYILIATEQDKISPTTGTTAVGTTAANADKIFTITSQRDLVTNFGSPTFQLDAAGNPINAHELNEYGLLAAYSALGVSNQMYIQRANIDLGQITGTSIRPTGTAVDGTYWLDLENTAWGIYEFADITGTSQGFVNATPLVITDTAQLSSGVPLSSVGQIGNYAVVASSSSNPVYYKGYTNNWSLVGSNAWKSNVATIIGTVANPTNLTITDKIIINNTAITSGATTISGVASAINSASIQGVRARARIDGVLELYADDTSASSGNVLIQDGRVEIKKGSTLGLGNVDLGEKIGFFSTTDGNIKTLNTPAVQFASYTNPPAWKTTDASPRPEGSVWFKTSATGNGANWGLKEYNSALDTWQLTAAPVYLSDTEAVRGLDYIGGGVNLPIGTVYVRYDTLGTTTGTFRPYVKNVAGIVKATGNLAGGSASYTINDSFTLEVSVPSSQTTQSATVVLTGITASSLVSDILSKG